MKPLYSGMKELGVELTNQANAAFGEPQPWLFFKSNNAITQLLLNV